MLSNQLNVKYSIHSGILPAAWLNTYKLLTVSAEKKGANPLTAKFPPGVPVVVMSELMMAQVCVKRD